MKKTMIYYRYSAVIPFTKRRILELIVRKVNTKMISFTNSIYPTFVFEDDLEHDIDYDSMSSEKSFSTTEFAHTYTDGIEFDWCKNVASNKSLLLRDERDPSLAESRLNFELEVTKKTHFQSISFNNINTERRKKNEQISIEIAEDKKPFTDIILRSDKDGDNLLFIAIIAKQTSLSLLLLDLISHYSRLRVHNKLFQTALHLASLTDNAEVTRRLVIAGIDVELRDRFGNTALHIACRIGSLQLVEALVTAVTYQETQLNTYEIPYQPIPQNFDIRNSEGLTCLHIAVIHKHRDVVALLLSKDANVNVIEMKAGKTCLHIAAEMGNNAMVGLILSKSRPELSAKTFNGYTATELAHYRGHDHIVYLLRCKGAQAARTIDKIENKPKFVEDTYLDEYDVDDDVGDDDYDDDMDRDEDDDCLIID